jgi:gas vesicle protein
MQDSMQDRIESYQRKRARAKFLFRIGLVTGLVAAFLLAPWPGSETRRQLGEYWQQVQQQAQALLERVF